MSKTPKIWTVFEAARYVDGKKQESLDARFDSSGKHRMVRLEDYQDLEQQLALVKESQQKWFDAYIAQVDETKKAEAEIAAAEKDAETWKERAEYEYGLRAYPSNPGLAVGALDATIKSGWRWAVKEEAIDAATGKEEK